jgi:hypothetical protein
MVELGDERSFRRGMSEVIGEVGKERIEEAVDYAVQEANRILLEETPPDAASLDEWQMQSIADSATTRWSPSEPEGELGAGDTYVAEWEHPHADKIEVGVKPHLIEGNDFLVFEWEDMPAGVEDQFRPQWEDPDSFLEEPQVIFAEVEHPGIPPVGFIKAGFRRSLGRFFSE